MKFMECENMSNSKQECLVLKIMLTFPEAPFIAVKEMLENPKNGNGPIQPISSNIHRYKNNLKNLDPRPNAIGNPPGTVLRPSD